MSDSLTDTPRSVRTDQIRQRLTAFRKIRKQGMFGVAEILGLGVSLLILLLTIVSYLYFLVPANSRLSALQRERDRLQTLLRTSRDVMRKGEDTQATVERITGSMEEFETRRLAQHAQGRMDLYDELNELIRKNGLRNTSGPTYTGLEPIGSKVAKKASSTKWQSVYPGIAVALTVEGQYQNLRHFIRDLETSKQFIIINGIELERATETNAPLSADGTAGATRGSLVSLRLDLATYFQRSTSEGGTAEAEQK
ncbi:MAG TPA: GspMb/PilO family protein [Pyrinomonadaceae bacterium]